MAAFLFFALLTGYLKIVIIIQNKCFAQFRGDKNRKFDI